ncbi:MAG: hypothetical protein HQL52_06325 [Magnetococcales bacterium]|nr:hypothetical protein [Magnetococcales bacterium]
MTKPNASPDLENLRINLNGHPQKVKTFRFQAGEGDDLGKVWLHVDLKDSQTGHDQHLEVEFTGLVSAWQHWAGFQEQFKAFSQEMQGVGLEFFERFQRGWAAFQEDLTRKKPPSEDP